MPAVAAPRRPAPPEQLEFRFAPVVAAEMRMDRLPDGRVLLTPSAEVRVWLRTDEAAEQLGKSRRWVQMALETGLLRGERIGRRGKWRVDGLHLQSVREAARNW